MTDASVTASMACMLTSPRPHQLTAPRMGAIFWIAGAAIFALGNIVAQLAWNTPYSLRDNNISDLGNVLCQNSDAVDNPPVRYICSPQHGLFNTSAIVAALLIIAGAFLTSRYWGKGVASKAARGLIVVGACGYALAGLWPADVDLDMHVLGALLIMGGGNIGLLVAGLAFRGGPLKHLQVPTLLIGGVAFVAAFLHFSGNYFGLGMGGTERIAIFALEVWMVVVAVHILRQGRRITT
ncbi:DUF998 domain-containing protein [Streptomyces sp. NPDC050433]|uniref:DUF998 domain-containing protein n=1 Tax=unclassified Streptomyces TaxID=2593676 RepID=UPI00341C73E7